MTVIYKITSPTGKVYIGQSRNFAQRLTDYLKPSGCKTQIKLHNSFQKYGVDNHTIEVLRECEPDIDQFFLDQLERFFWAVENGNGKVMLNVREPNGTRGKHSEETKIRMSISAMGNTKFLGKKHNEATKELIRQSKIGSKNPMFGKSPSLETILKKSASQTGKLTGIKHPLVKLTEKDVQEIWNLLTRKVYHKDIANLYNVSSTTITRISTGFNWNHITGLPKQQNKSI